MRLPKPAEKQRLKSNTRKQERVKQHKETEIIEGYGIAVRHGGKSLDCVEWTTMGLAKRLG